MLGLSGLLVVEEINFGLWIFWLVWVFWYLGLEMEFTYKSLQPGLFLAWPCYILPHFQVFFGLKIPCGIFIAKSFGSGFWSFGHKWQRAAFTIVDVLDNTEYRNVYKRVAKKKG